MPDKPKKPSTLGRVAHIISHLSSPSLGQQDTSVVMITKALLCCVSLASLLAAALPVPPANNDTTVQPLPTNSTNTTIMAKNTSNIRNDFINDGECKAIMLVFAKGSTQAGNIGDTAGLSFVKALEATAPAGTVSVQGVNNYPATILEYMEGGSTSGGKDMANVTTKIVQTCPNSAVFMGGYSQGGQVVHLATAQMPQDVTSKLFGVIIFGDGSGKLANVTGVPASKVLEICHDGDSICQGPSAIVTSAHLNYGMDNQTAADWVMRMSSGIKTLADPAPLC
ncbi:hypothetical protein SeMB42_g03775 [Synchytrium endobioticum]|uniref:cutinase n=1 Tax=Synchytrium endobioticum TaxID=286115 RepID=A0A507D4U7_9FUNG|nr:hypothetical protein SeLEV6574_g03626 [Synchytrium endobioticum]TPX46270.1 hypothetical protein SeMB42_g03775 [Synchytrium endobioticum]